jgi:hypothetical protein
MPFAWSEIRGSDSEGKAVVVKPGDEVSAGDLNLNDEEFQELVDAGVVRDNDYPEDIPEDQSPTEYYKAQLAALAESGELPPEQPPAEEPPPEG